MCAFMNCCYKLIICPKQPDILLFKCDCRICHCLRLGFCICVAELRIGGCVTSPSDQQEESTEGGESGRACEPFPCGDTQG